MRSYYFTIIYLSGAFLACGEIKSMGPVDVPVPTDAPASVDAQGDATSTVTLTVMKNGNGTGTVISSSAGISCGGNCTNTYAFGSIVTLTATPDAGTTFVGWTGGGCSGTAGCVITLNANTTVQASFAQNDSLIVTLAGGGTGSVSSGDGYIQCGTACSHQYSPSSVVTLTATPGTGSTFTGWAGGGCSGIGTCTVTINQATGVAATFELKEFPFAVAKTGNGTGTITSTDGSINCGSACATMHSYGDIVTLNATPTTGSMLTGWSGGGCSGTGSCVVTVSAATTVTAIFALTTYTLTVAKAGNGNGTVASTDGSINCGSTCIAMGADPGLHRIP